MAQHDTCFDRKDLIDRERNAVDLYDQRDSKGQMSFSSFSQLPAKFPADSVAPSNDVWNIGDRIFAPILVQQHALTAQFSNSSGMQSSFETYLPLTNMPW